MSSMLNDAMLEWVDTRCDEIRFIRDSRHARIEIDFCYESSGCPGSIIYAEKPLSLYYAVSKAIEEQQL